MTHNILGLAIAIAILWMGCSIPARALTGTDGNFYMAPWQEQYYHDEQESLKRSNEQAARDFEQNQIQHDNEMKMDRMQREIDDLNSNNGGY